MNGVSKWVEFRYEKSPDFCYSCGIIGHSDKSCKLRKENQAVTGKQQYGPWMRTQVMRSSPKKKVDPKPIPEAVGKIPENSAAHRLLFEGDYIINPHKRMEMQEEKSYQQRHSDERPGERSGGTSTESFQT